MSGYELRGAPVTGPQMYNYNQSDYEFPIEGNDEQLVDVKVKDEPKEEKNVQYAKLLRKSNV